MNDEFLDTSRWVMSTKKSSLFLGWGLELLWEVTSFLLTLVFSPITFASYLSNLDKKSFWILKEGEGTYLVFPWHQREFTFIQVNRFSCILQGNYIVPLQYFGTIFSPPLFSFFFCEMPSTANKFRMSKCSGNQKTRITNKENILHHPKFILYILTYCPTPIKTFKVYNWSWSEPSKSKVLNNVVVTILH